ncbi:MAG: YlxM family DNA-binding protein [Bacillota bacterium]|nr:YlxM family DNA-binding protein [Bacillota bacterium]MDW7728690.1 YlxM family DNA-binding protein [Bacillota bacterium]
MLDQLNRINLLYDIYASLLTIRQQEVLQLYFSDNYSLAEIAAEYGISRQAVHDLIQRSLASLEKLEKKLGLYSLYNEQQELIDEAEKLLDSNNLQQKEINRLREIIAGLRISTEQ